MSSGSNRLLAGVVGGILEPPLTRLWTRLGTLSPREAGMGLALVAVFSLLLFRVGRTVVLLDLPVTDDEEGALFCGQVLAMSRLLVEAPAPANSFPALFLYLRDGLVTSFDWLGA